MGFPNIWNSIPRPNLTHLATYMCVCVCVHVSACVRGRTHTHIYTHTHTHTHWYGCTHTRVYTCMCIYPTHSVTTRTLCFSFILIPVLLWILNCLFLNVRCHIPFVLRVCKNLCCICGGTKREVIPVKYGRGLALTRYMHPLHFSSICVLTCS